MSCKMEMSLRDAKLQRCWRKPKIFSHSSVNEAVTTCPWDNYDEDDHQGNLPSINENFLDNQPVVPLERLSNFIYVFFFFFFFFFFFYGFIPVCRGCRCGSSFYILSNEGRLPPSLSSLSGHRRYSLAVFSLVFLFVFYPLPGFSFFSLRMIPLFL